MKKSTDLNNIVSSQKIRQFKTKGVLEIQIVQSSEEYVHCVYTQMGRRKIFSDKIFRSSINRQKKQKNQKQAVTWLRGEK